MTTIKLKCYYPYLTENITLEVSDEIAVVLSTGGRLCDSYKRRKREHNECSLDVDPGFEPDVMFPPLTPEEIILDEENRSILDFATTFTDESENRPAEKSAGTGQGKNKEQSGMFININKNIQSGNR
ncbi:MAG: hypothetical protein HFH35_15845 [Eubacterium sp.]|jgi:hypothetical protein|nr:hypothetical protein [Lachnospiraceae bacterium]MCI9125500.1 hypothetical protein [Eubacterium sp.]